MLAISLYPYIHNIPIGRLHAGSPCLHMFFTSLCFGTMPKPKGQTKVLVFFSDLLMCMSVCVCVLPLFGILCGFLCNLTFDVLVSMRSLPRLPFRAVKICSPSTCIGWSSLADPGSQSRSGSRSRSCSRSKSRLPFWQRQHVPQHSCPCCPYVVAIGCGCNIIEIDIVHMRHIAATAPLIGATRRVPLRVSATISGIYCLTSRMQIGQHWRPNQSTCQAICHSGSSAPNAANCDRLSMPSILIWAQ